jgi:hypothetical protein
VIGTSSRRWVAAAAAAVVVLVAGVVVLVAGGDDTGGVDCATLRVTPDLWAAADYDRRLQLQKGITDCGQLDGQPDTQVVATLGPPDRNAADEIDYFLPFGDGTDRSVWRIFLDDENTVKSSRVESPG